MNLILVEPHETGAAGRVVLDDARARHLLGVLGVVPGRDVRVGLVDGPLGRGLVTAVTDNAVELTCTWEAAPPPRPDVDLLLALPRPKVMRRLWAQLAALGVGRILVTNAARVERHYFDAHVLSEAVYRPLLVEGLQQARDTRVPDVSIHRQFRILVEDDLDRLVPGTRRLLADPGAPRSVTAALQDTGPGRVLLAVGPEGGWNDFERGLLVGRGFHPVGMGARTLRTDTACVALLSLVHAARA